MNGDILIEGFVFLVGSAVGSFCNLCIYRLPRNLAIGVTRSRCIRCGSVVSWYDNIPLWSCLRLWGRCRSCGTPFGFWHLGVEICMGIVAVYLYRKEGLSFPSVYYFVLTAALVIVSAIDMRHRIIPDIISIPGIIIGLVVASLATVLHFPWPVGFSNALIGSFLGAFVLWMVGFCYEKVTGREGIGFGDVKLLALFGANTGIYGVLASLFFGAAFGSLAGVLLIVLKRGNARSPIPFGPFLCFGLLLYALFGWDQMALLLFW